MSVNIKYGTYVPKNHLKKDEIDIRIGVFFDGTANSMANSRAGGQIPNHKRTQKEIDAYNKHSDKESDSYLNDYSNVARKFLHYIKNDSKKIGRIYIEGIGTEDLKADNDDPLDHLGMGAGAGPTGIRGKVRRGCEMLVKKIISLNGKKKVDCLTLDVFGFSRGAAAARNFVYEIKKSKYASIQSVKPVKVNTKEQEQVKYVKIFVDSDKIETKYKELPARGHFGVALLAGEDKIEVAAVNIRFVGIYDTVSSYDPFATNTTVHPNFNNDVNELNLNTLSAKKIIQFVAEDEHRKNFMITKSSKAGGIDYIVPGVHSDVGGCYVHSKPEKVQLLDFDNIMGDGLYDEQHDKILNNDLNHLISHGWFTEKEVTRPNTWHETYGNRAKISNRYSYVILHLMAELVNENYKGTINLENLKSEFSLPEPDSYFNADLNKVKQRLKEYISGKKPKMKYYTNKEIENLSKKLKTKEIDIKDFNLIVNDHNMLLLLRNRYFHFSAKFGTVGLEPNFILDKENLKITRIRKTAPNS